MEPHRIRLRNHWLNTAGVPGPSPGWDGPGTYLRRFGQPPLPDAEEIWLLGAEFVGTIAIELNGAPIGTFEHSFAVRLQTLQPRNELECTTNQNDAGMIWLEIRAKGVD